MHLTLGVLALKDSTDVAKATAALAGALEAAGGARGGVRVKLVGLKTFEGGKVLGAGGRGGRGCGRGRGRGRRDGHCHGRRCVRPDKGDCGGGGGVGGLERQDVKGEEVGEEDGEGEGGGVALDRAEVTGVRAEREEAQETDNAGADADADGDSGGGGGGGGNNGAKRAWEVKREEPKSEPKPDYESCRVLWVEPRDANANANANANVSVVGPGSVVDSEKGGIGTGHRMEEAGKEEEEEEEEEEGLLRPTCCSMRNYFLSQDLLHLSPKDKDRDNKNLILHMTVLNATYAKERHRGGGGGGSGGGGGGWNLRGRCGGYNVSRLVENFKDVVWAEDVLFDKLELMRMGEIKGEVGSEREGESWYESIGAVNL